MKTDWRLFQFVENKRDLKLNTMHHLRFSLVIKKKKKKLLGKPAI